MQRVVDAMDRGAERHFAGQPIEVAAQPQLELFKEVIDGQAQSAPITIAH
jgi:hypothetical protein